jgi:hypothetical protein
MWRIGPIRLHRQFPRVWLAWGKWWAAQLYLYPCLSVGIHIDPRRPLLDLHLGILTVSFGPAAHITGQEDRHRQSCRGFMFSDDPRARL